MIDKIKNDSEKYYYDKLYYWAKKNPNEVMRERVETKVKLMLGEDSLRKLQIIYKF